MCIVRWPVSRRIRCVLTVVVEPVLAIGTDGEVKIYVVEVLVEVGFPESLALLCHGCECSSCTVHGKFKRSPGTTCPPSANRARSSNRPTRTVTDRILLVLYTR